MMGSGCLDTVILLVFQLFLISQYVHSTKRYLMSRKTKQNILFLVVVEFLTQTE